MNNRKTNHLLIAITMVVLTISQASLCAAPRVATTNSAKSAAKLEAEITQIIKKMTLEEKQAMCHGNGSMDGGGCKRLGIAALRMSDGPLGVSRTSQPTGFGSGMLLAQTWNPDLLYSAGVVLGREADAGGVDVILGPGINIARDLVCGRTFEYYTEDPYLNGMLAARMVQGIQSQGVAATMKHFIANNQENNREGANAIIDERTLREIYLPGYEMGVKQGGAWAVMAQCGLVNGVECYGTPLIRKVLKDEYGFKGLAMTDWGSVAEGGTITGPTELTAKNGMDLSMPNPGSYSTLAALVTKGKLSQSTLDDMVRRILRVSYYAGVAGWGPPSPAGQINTEANHAVTRKVAEEGIVLLKNTQSLLPLVKGQVQKICLTGCNAIVKQCYGGGSSAVHVPYEITPMAGLEKYGGLAVNYQPTQSGAVEAAETSDVTIIVTGYQHAIPYQGGDTEGSDRDDMSFPKSEISLINAVSKVSRKVVVVVVGGPGELRDWIDNVSAVLYEAYPGMEHGNALARVLFGDVNPSGKLTITWPKRDSDQPSYKTRNESLVKYSEGIFVGYRGYEKKHIKPEFAFGHGLSYTRFAYFNLSVKSQQNYNTNPRVSVSIDVKNTGARAGMETVQLYVQPVSPGVARPVKELKGFAKVMLQPGQTKSVTLTLNQRSFAYWSELNNWYAEPGKYKLLVGSASDDIRLTGSVTLKAVPGAKARPKPKPAPKIAEQKATAPKRYEGKPYGGHMWVIPGMIEAENFDMGGEGVAYHDTTVGNAGGMHRSEDVDIQPTTDAGGGFNVCTIAAGEWLNYSLSIPQPGSYTMEMRVSREMPGHSSFHIEVDGTDVTGRVLIPSTGGWQTWTTIIKKGVYLNTINQVMKIVCDGGNFNINWIKFISEGSTAK